MHDKHNTGNRHERMGAAPTRVTMRVTTLAGMICVGLSACAVGPDYERPSAPVPAAYKEADSVTADARIPTAWWHWFDDPVLDDLQHQVLVSNQNIAAASAAWQQALSVVSTQRASLWPGINAQAGGQRGRSRSAAGENSPVINTVTAGVSASWTLDVWGKLRRSLESAKASAQVSEADLAAATLSNQSLLAISYLQLRAADAELHLLTDTLADYQKSLQITQNRYQAGMVARADVAQAQTQVANAEAQRAALQWQRAQLEHAIASLVGKPSSDFTLAANEHWQAVVPVVAAGIPSELLRDRPDVVAAERVVAAASANIGIQKAAYFPSLTLTGSENFIAGSLGDLFSPANRVWNAAATAAGPLFDAGATSARVRGARAAYDVAVAQYRQTVLQAFQNVEDHLAGARFLNEQAAATQRAVDAALLAQQILMNQYQAGSINYTDVVSAQAAALSAQRSLAQVKLAQQTNAVSLIAALGGGVRDGVDVEQVFE